MSKKFLIIISMFLILVSVFANVCYAETITLSKIATNFKNSELVKQYETSGVRVNVTNTENTLTITTTLTDNTNNTFEYTLNGNILSANFDEENAFAGAVISMYVVDSIGQLHGYAKEELLTTLGSKDIVNYTVEKEGIKMSPGTGGQFILQVDITKKIPLMNFDNTYIEVSDLKDLKDFITGNGSAQLPKGKIVLHKSGYDNEAVVFVAEEKNLTTNAYKSILSVLEVMFNTTKAPNYFEENYSSSFSQNKVFEGFKVEVNPEKSSMEQNILGNDDSYKFVRITIDKEVASKAISEFNKNDDNKNSIIQTDKATNVKLETTTSAVPSETKLVVEKVTKGEKYNTVLKILEQDVNKFVLFDISLMNNNVAIQPNGKVKISLPIPSGYDKEKISVYRIEEDGKKVKYNAEIKDNYAVIETDHFSNYVVAEEKNNTKNPNASQNNGNTNNKDNTVLPSGSLPKTGEKICFALGTIFMIIVGIVSYGKIKKYKGM